MPHGTLQTVCFLRWLFLCGEYRFQSYLVLNKTVCVPFVLFHMRKHTINTEKTVRIPHKANQPPGTHARTYVYARGLFFLN